MSRSLFLTGGSGFVGRRLLARLDPETFDRITILARGTFPLPPRLERSPRVALLRSDLARPERYAGAMDPDTVVLHLAARTGSAAPEAFERDNVKGTLALLEAAETQGVRGFVNVSSIAVRFPEAVHYPYADSKREAETLVSSGTRPWVTVRPTVVLAPESPTWLKLRRIARAPLLVIPGDGQVRMQPIHADDLVTTLLRLAEADEFARTAFDLGGGDVLTVEDFLRRAHRRFHRRGGPALHAPIGLGLPFLRALERISPVPLPVTEGQFSSFLHDAVAMASPLQERFGAGARGVDAMLAELIPGRGGRARAV